MFIRLHCWVAVSGRIYLLNLWFLCNKSNENCNAWLQHYTPPSSWGARFCSGQAATKGKHPPSCELNRFPVNKRKRLNFVFEKYTFSENLPVYCFILEIRIKSNIEIWPCSQQLIWLSDLRSRGQLAKIRIMYIRDVIGSRFQNSRDSSRSSI